MLAGWAARAGPAPPHDFVDLPGGRFVMGDPQGEPDEAPRTVEVAPFRLMRFEVTNREFAAFVAASGHVTDPERTGFGWIWPGRLAAGGRGGVAPTVGSRQLDRWRPRSPGGPGLGPGCCALLPLLRLAPAERGGMGVRRARQRSPPRSWGDAPPEQPSRLANFGTVRCCAADDADGHRSTAPVGSYPSGASPFGLMDMAGNVWEWTASGFPGRPAQVVLRGGGWGNDLYCLRTAYRHGDPPDIGLDMVGFRCAAEVDP